MSRTAESEDGLPIPQRHWSAVAIWLAITLAVLDSAVANIALPTIAREFQVEPHEAIWVVNGYQLAIVTALLPCASLGEIVGYRRVYLVGLVVFTAASLLCALSSSLLELALGRVLQGLGAAGIMSINAALVRFTYPQALLGRAIGFNALVVALAAATGPSLAAAILSVAHWPWLFAVNVPIGCLTLAVAAYALPRPAPVRRRFDVAGAVLNALAFGLVIGGIDLLTRTGSPLVGALLLAGGVVSGAALVVKSRTEATPILPVDLMRIPVFALSVGSSVLSFAAQMLALVSLPFLFDGLLGRSPVETGLLMTPWPIMVGLLGPLAGSLADRLPASILGGVGLAVMACGLAALALIRPDATFLDVAWRMALCGIGFGFFQAPNNRTMMLAAPRARAGAAGGMLATARLTGQTAGTTLVAVFFALRPADGTVVALWAAAGFALAGACVSLGRLAAGRENG
jgi:DHA2 family multidrug resistance protein-like MFS transporter